MKDSEGGVSGLIEVYHIDIYLEGLKNKETG
jgi:hypothetical protein